MGGIKHASWRVLDIELNVSDARLRNPAGEGPVGRDVIPFVCPDGSLPSSFPPVWNLLACNHWCLAANRAAPQYNSLSRSSRIFSLELLDCFIDEVLKEG